jgi:hypothetical protein
MAIITVITISTHVQVMLSVGFNQQIFFRGQEVSIETTSTAAINDITPKLLMGTEH